jgi:quercetin dioxygenase-like cupin family protein
MTPLEETVTGAQRPPEPTGSPFLSFDLAAELERLHIEDHPWQAGRNGKILVKYPNLRILLIGLRPGAHLAQHHADGPVSIQVVSGHVLARAAGKVFELKEEQLLALEAQVPHDVEALAESAVLVTIAWPGENRR